LENDEDMVELMISEKARRGGDLPPNHEHEEVELLLENHLREFNTLHREAQILRKRIQATQEVVNINMDNYRNRIIRANLGISIASLGTSSAVVMASLFGMNLVSGLEDHPSMFYWACAASLTFSGSLVYHAVQTVRATPAESAVTGMTPARFHGVIDADDDLQDILLASMRQRGGAGMSIDEFADILGVAAGRSIDPEAENVKLIFKTFAEPPAGKTVLDGIPLWRGDTPGKRGSNQGELVMYPRGMLQLLSRQQGYRELHGRNPEG
jgi:hypothetical protein